MDNEGLIIQILEQYGNQIINDYRRLLYEGGSNASGLLGNSLVSRVNAEDGIYEVSLEIQDYWKYLEFGRKAGKFPNIDAIKKWIQVKPVTPTVYNGKLPTLDQLAYLISRKIARDGIEPRYYLTNTLIKLDLKPLEDGITRILETNIDNALRQV